MKIIYNIRFSISKQYKLGMGYLFLTSGNLFSLLIFVREFIQIYVSNSYCNYLEKYLVSREECFYLYVDLLFHFTFHINKGTNYLLMFEFCIFFHIFLAFRNNAHFMMVTTIFDRPATHTIRVTCILLYWI